MTVHRHNLIPPQIKTKRSQRCAICEKIRPVTTEGRLCLGCNAFACSDCIGRYKTDAGFVMHIRYHADKNLFPYFCKHAETVRIATRSIEGISIYHEYQMYNLTDEYISDLKTAIDSRQKELETLMAQTQEIRNQLLAFKVELIQAQQHKKKEPH